MRLERGRCRLLRFRVKSKGPLPGTSKVLFSKDSACSCARRELERGLQLRPCGVRILHRLCLATSKGVTTDFNGHVCSCDPLLVLQKMWPYSYDDEDEDAAELSPDRVVLSVKCAARLGWSLDSPLTVGKVKQLLAIHENMNASERNRMTRAQSKAMKTAAQFTEQDLAIAKEVAAVSNWDFQKFVRSGDVGFLLQQARLREKATPVELGWDAVIRGMVPGGSRHPFVPFARGIKLLPMLASRVATLGQICSTVSAHSKDPLYLVAIGPYQYMAGDKFVIFILSFHLVAMTEASLRSFYQRFRAAERKHRCSSLPFNDEHLAILAFHPLSAPDDHRDLQFVHQLAAVFTACNGKPLVSALPIWIARIKSSTDADVTPRNPDAQGIQYSPFCEMSPVIHLSVSPVCFLPSLSSHAAVAVSVETNVGVPMTHSKQTDEEHPIRIHQDLISQLIPVISLNQPVLDDQIGLLMYHPEHKTPTDSSGAISYAQVQEFYKAVYQKTAVSAVSAPCVMHLVRMVPGEHTSEPVQKKLQALLAHGWLLGGVVALRLQSGCAGAHLTDVLNHLFASESFVQHVHPMVRLSHLSAVCILIDPSTSDQVDLHPISINSYVVPSDWLLSGAVNCLPQDWNRFHADREPWYSVAPLKVHEEVYQLEAAANEKSESNSI